MPNAIKEKLLVSTLLTISIAHVLDFVLLMPLGPMLMTEFDMSAAEFGYVVSAYTFAAAFSSLVGMLWIDRIDRRMAMMLLLLGFTTGNVMCVFSDDLYFLLVARVVSGLFGGVMSSLVYSIVGQLIPLERRGRVSGLLGTAFPIVSVAGVPFGLKLADYLGWRAAFLFVVGMSVLAFTLVILVLPKIAPDSEKGKGFTAPLIEIWQYRPHRLGAFLILLVVLGGFTIVPYIAPFLINNGYILSSQLYLVYLFGGACSILSARAVGVISDRFGVARTLRVVLLLAMLALAVFTNLPKVPLPLVILVTSCLMMFLPARYICIMAWQTVICLPKTRGSYMSLISTVQQSAVGLASLIGGALVGESASGEISTYWLAGGFAISINLVIFGLVPKIRQLEIKLGKVS